MPGGRASRRKGVAACALCELAATPWKERLTETLGGFTLHDVDGPKQYEVVHDTDKDGAPDRLLCFRLEHSEVPERDKPIMGTILKDYADELWGDGNWSYEVTMRSCPEHGWHCHARRTA